MSLDVCTSYKKISVQEERILVAKAKEGNQKAARILVNSIMPLIVNMANSIPKGALTSDDLIAEGVIGAYKAIDKYTMDNTARWATYAMLNEKFAVGWVKQMMQRAIHKAHVVGVSTKARLAGQYNTVMSYDAPIHNNIDDKTTLADVLADENAVDPSEPVAVINLEIQDVIHEIEDADLRKLMTLFANGMTTREVGKEFGISRMTALNRQNKAIEIIKHSIKV